MSQRKSYAVGTGLFIVLGFAALAYLATQTSSVANRHQGDSYTVDAQFTNVGQLKERAPVKVAGVRIGQVQSIELEPGKPVADVKLSIDKRYASIPADSVASIFTSGLLGDQYVGIEYGHAKTFVAAGGKLALTHSSQPLEAMIGKFFGAGGVNDNIGGTYQVTANFTNIGPDQTRRSQPRRNDPRSPAVRHRPSRQPTPRAARRPAVRHRDPRTPHPYRGA